MFLPEKHFAKRFTWSRTLEWQVTLSDFIDSNEAPIFKEIFKEIFMEISW